MPFACLVDCRHDLGYLFLIGAARRAELKSARQALEQVDTKFFFEVTQLARDGGLRDVKIA